MSEQQDRDPRTEWITRINLRPWAKEQIRLIATGERMSVATTIGMVIEQYVTARSTA